MSDKGDPGAPPGAVPEAKAPAQRVRPTGHPGGKKNTSCGLACLKYLMFVINLVVWILGLAIVVVSGITLARSGDKEIDMTGVQSVQNAAATAMFLGCLLLIVGFLGCCGSIRESPIMLTVYFGVLLLVLILEFAAMGLAFSYVNSSTMNEHLRDHFADVISGGRSDKEHWRQEQDRNTIYFVQAQLRCCGGTGPNDYMVANQDIPPSCYDRRDDTKPYLFERGCVDALADYVRRNGLGIGLVNLFSLFVEIAAMVSACMLIQHFRDTRTGKNMSNA